MLIPPFGQYYHLKEDSSDYLTVDLPSTTDHIGITAQAGTAIILNGQQIIIGNSGTFEIEMPVTSLSIPSSATVIVDYHYVVN